MKPSKECRQETETSISVWWEIYIIIPKFYKHSPCIFHFTVLQTELLNLRFRVLLLSCLFFNHFSSPATIFSFPLFLFSPIPLSSCLSFLLLSEIPAVSLCPPDSECATEAQLTVIQSEGELCDSCSSLGRPSSSCQLYHQVCMSTVCTVCCVG